MDQRKLFEILSIAERPVKLLLQKYFTTVVNLMESRLIKKIKNISTYTDIRDLIQISNDETITKHVVGDSILRLPINNPINLTSNFGELKLQLDIVLSDFVWNDEQFINHNAIGVIKNMITAALCVFDFLKKSPNNPMLATIELKLDSKNLTLYLYDSQFPDHPFGPVDYRLGIISI